MMMMFQARVVLQRVLFNSSNIELNTIKCRFKHHLSQPQLTPRGITELLSRNQISLSSSLLPNYVKSIECNQLGSNSPIEDRLRISTVQVPGSEEPTLIMGVFDGHGGGTTADLISRRLFNYIALALHPEPSKLKISSPLQMNDIVVDLHKSPRQDEQAFEVLHDVEYKSLVNYSKGLNNSKQQRLKQFPSSTMKPHQDQIIANIKSSFQSCDDDLSREIQDHLMGAKRVNVELLRYYLSASVSGCCAIVMIVHDGVGYLASSGDCRAVLGLISHHEQIQPTNALFDNKITAIEFRALELNDEHNCDNVNEIRRLASAHPKSEQNTMIKENRLLGHLMPFRAFGDFTYKWPADLIKACGITRAFGPRVIPSHYETPPYLVVEPDVNTIQISKDNFGEISTTTKPNTTTTTTTKSTKKSILQTNESQHDLLLNEIVADLKNNHVECTSMDRYLVIASDGLWELFESSREVIETIVEHSKNAAMSPITIDEEEDYDKNCATHILRSALQFRNSLQDVGVEPAELRRRYHYRLESTLSLPASVSRNFRDDISIIVLKL